jgi:acyl-CoA thioesterase-1
VPLLRRRDFNLLGLSLLIQGVLQPLAFANPRTLLVVGDSLSAEYGLPRGSGWVALLEQQLGRDKSPWRVVNASISGDTTAGGRARLPSLLKQHQPSTVIIELGANDALRGFPLAMTEDNLQAMIQACQALSAKVLLLGMQVPPNYGADYSADFSKMFTRLAKKRKTAVVPFLLKGIADVPNAAEQFQADRIHPNAQAHPRMLANVWAELKKLL